MPPTPPIQNLIKMLGTNTHMAYTTNSVDNMDHLLAMLGPLGNPPIRDGASWYPTGNPSGNQVNYSRWTNFAKGQINGVLDWTTTKTNIADVACQINTLAAGHNSSWEGPNEIDLTGGDWVTPLRSWCNAAYPAFKTCTNVPILAPSMGNTIANAAKLGRVPCDKGNIHVYNGSEIPENNSAYSLSNYINAARLICGPTAGIWITETGYHNALNTTQTGGYTPVDQATAAKYSARTLLYAYLKGIERVYLYELVNQGNVNQADAALTNPQIHFGLHGVNLSPKPSGAYFVNLIAYCKDLATPGPTTKIGMNDSGYNGMGIQYATFSRSNGNVIVFLWQPKASWDATAKAPIAVAPINLQLKFSTANLPPGSNWAQYYDPMTNTRTPLASVAQVTVPVADYPRLVEVGLAPN